MLQEKDKKIILALAENGMMAKRAARKLGLHWNVVYYRMDKIYDYTGLNPKDFYDLQKLAELVQAEENEKEQKYEEK